MPEDIVNSSHPKVLRIVNRETIDADPYAVWNAFVNLVAMEKYEALNEIQKAAHLCFWYEHEVQNGGHLQYFENEGTLLVKQTLAALSAVGADFQRKVLEQAAEVFLRRPRETIETVEEYVDTALEGQFNSFDSAYYACRPEMPDLLRDYLAKHQDQFVRVE